MHKIIGVSSMRRESYAETLLEECLNPQTQLKRMSKWLRYDDDTQIWKKDGLCNVFCWHFAIQTHAKS